MKREILFRGFCPNKSGDETIILDEEEIMGDWHYWNCFDGINRLNAGFMVADTVGQWTGLTDKNEKRIFEMDRVYSNRMKNYYIVFYEDCAFRIEGEYGNRILMKQEAITHMGVEVIGTIFDKED